MSFSGACSCRCTGPVVHYVNRRVDLNIHQELKISKFVCDRPVHVVAVMQVHADELMCDAEERRRDRPSEPRQATSMNMDLTRRSTDGEDPETYPSLTTPFVQLSWTTQAVHHVWMQKIRFPVLRSQPEKSICPVDLHWAVGGIERESSAPHSEAQRLGLMTVERVGRQRQEREKLLAERSVGSSACERR